ncbi:MAG: hemerythrin domain-containing protein [Gammaproteobacteria bacterium]
MDKDIYEVLMEEHKEAKSLLEKLASSTAQQDAEMRREKGRKLALELITHDEAESATLYDRLMEFDDMRDHVAEHQSEHEEANDELRSLLDIDVEDSEWLDKLKEIKKAVEHHVEDEENKLFPEAKKHLSEDEAKKMARKFKQEQDRRKEQMQAA